MGGLISKEQQEQLRDKVLSEIRDRQEEFVQLLSHLVQYPTENPPGDTVGLADFVSGWLSKQGIETQFVEPRPTMKSVLSTFNRGNTDVVHFMFNGHLDVFPVSAPDLWRIPPFEGRIENGKVHGRGVADMKGGLTASMIAYSLLYNLRDDLPARVSLTAVGDEETSGLWGTEWILDNCPDWLPDACMIGEPSSPDIVSIGEKGISQITVTIEGKSSPGALGAGDNCILRMAQALILLQDVVDLRPDIPKALRPIIDEAMTHNHTGGTRGIGHLLERPSFNIGRIEGGVMVNVAPRDVVAKVDIRVPFGITPDDILAWTRQRLGEAGFGDAKVELIPYRSSANYTDPQHPLSQIVKRNAAQFCGTEPRFAINAGASDGRFFRQRGIPTIIHGPRSQNCAAPDEHITIRDFVAVLQVHACSAVDYIAKSGGAGDRQPNRD